MGAEDHWNAAYADSAPDALSWFEDAPRETIPLIERHVPPRGAAVDVGGGASGMAVALLRRGHAPVTVLDLSTAALRLNRERAGTDGDAITWVEGDVTAWADPPRVKLWHDRAVFHFLTDSAAQAAYLDALARSLSPGGHALIATFSETGPERCSGLPVARWSPGALADRVAALAPGHLRPVAKDRFVHVTPTGREQAFQATLFERA